MHRSLLSLALLFKVSATALAQGSTNASSPDTIAITSRVPLRVRLVNSGAEVVVLNATLPSTDTMVLTTPVRLALPHAAFALDIQTMSTAEEATIVFATYPRATPKPHQYEATFFTPMRVQRDSAAGPIVVKSVKMQARRSP